MKVGNRVLRKKNQFKTQLITDSIQFLSSSNSHFFQSCILLIDLIFKKHTYSKKGSQFHKTEHWWSNLLPFLPGRSRGGREWERYWCFSTEPWGKTPGADQSRWLRLNNGVRATESRSLLCRKRQSCSNSESSMHPMLLQLCKEILSNPNLLLQFSAFLFTEAKGVGLSAASPPRYISEPRYWAQRRGVQ